MVGSRQRVQFVKGFVQRGPLVSMFSNDDFSAPQEQERQPPAAPKCSVFVLAAMVGGR